MVTYDQGNRFLPTGSAIIYTSLSSGFDIRKVEAESRTICRVASGARVSDIVEDNFDVIFAGIANTRAKSEIMLIEAVQSYVLRFDEMTSQIAEFQIIPLNDKLTVLEMMARTYAASLLQPGWIKTATLYRGMVYLSQTLPSYEDGPFLRLDSLAELAQNGDYEGIEKFFNKIRARLG